jgi:hypothetical protein
MRMKSVKVSPYETFYLIGSNGEVLNLQVGRIFYLVNRKKGKLVFDEIE